MTFIYTESWLWNNNEKLESYLHPNPKQYKFRTTITTGTTATRHNIIEYNSKN